jgi:hypothetical protein
MKVNATLWKASILLANEPEITTQSLQMFAYVLGKRIVPK